MGYITLQITNKCETKDYVLFHAEYLNEAWLAQLHADDSTKIIKQFQCKRMEQCFFEGAKAISKLGVVTKITATDIDAHIVKLLQNSLNKRPYRFAAYPDVADFNTSFATQTIWDWFANTVPTMRIAS